MSSRISPEKYAKAKEIFLTSLEINAAERAEFVRRECGGDAKLLAEVNSLLTVSERAEGFLELPAATVVSLHEHWKNKKIGNYRLLRELGEGGMGAVFLAEQLSAGFQRQVAIKFVKKSLFSQSLLKRFNRERQILATLEHPNIAHLIDGGATDDNLPYLVMEYVEGVPLLEYVLTNNLSLAARLDLFRQICGAVAYAHKRAVIHRDLKPSNILVTKDGTAKLLDFGIAKMLLDEDFSKRETTTTFRAMTPEYASPEQIKGETVTTVSDVYSLGVVLYELLTEIHPYKINSGNLNEIIHAVCEVEPPRPSAAITPKSEFLNPKSLKGDLDKIILKALSKEPENRYSSVEQLDEDLRRHLRGLPVSARRPTFAYRAEKFIRRNRAAAVFAVLGILAMLGGIAATVWQAHRAEHERARAERRFNDVRSLAKSFMFELNDEILKGQTPARELVVRRALEYLDSLAGEAKGDISLQRELAVAYLKIGDIQGKPYSPNLGDTDGALESYNKAAAILEQIFNLNPQNLEIKFDLGSTYSAIGALQSLRLRNKEEAIKTLQKSRVLGEALVAADPSNLLYRGMLADVFKFLGDSLSDVNERLQMHQKALAIREESLIAEPANIQENTAAASLYQRIGTIYSDKAAGSKNPDDFRAALENFNKSLTIYENLQKYEPNNSRHRRNFADILAMRILTQANLGDKSGAAEGYQNALEILRKIAGADPKNIEAQFDLAYTHQFMCRGLLKLNDIPEAIKRCREGLEIIESLLAVDPKNGEAQHYISISYKYLTEDLEKISDFNDLMRTLQHWFAVAKKLSAGDFQTAQTLYQTAEIALQIGDAYMKISTKKLSAGKKKEYLQKAREWFMQSQIFLQDLEMRFGLRKIDADTAELVKHKISDLNEMLR